MLSDRTGFALLLASAAGLLLLWVIVKIKARGKAPKIHPRLQKYAGDDAEYVQQRRAEANKIIATSSTAHIVGYEMVEQIEALYVDGFRRPEEALEGIKAVAAMKGANAVINLRHERTTAGKCSASGDAIVVQKVDS